MSQHHPAMEPQRSDSRSDRVYRILELPAAHPWVTLLVTAMCLALSIVALRRTRFEANLEGMLAETPAAKALVRVFNDFSAADELLVLVSAPDRTGSAGGTSGTSGTSGAELPADPEKLLGFAQRLQDSTIASPEARDLVQSVAWRAEAQAIGFVKDQIVPAGPYYLDDQAFAAFRQRLTPEGIGKQIQRSEALLGNPGPAAAALSKIVQQDPLRLHEFILARLAAQQPFQTYQNSDAFLSPDGRHLLIRIVGKKPPSDLAFCRKLTQTIADIAQQANTDHLSVKLAGAYAISTASEHAIRQDMVWSVTGSVILLQILFLLAYRNYFRFLLAFIPVALGIVLGFGLHSAFFATLTPLTAVIGGVLAGMGIDYTVQFLSQYERERSAGRLPFQAIQQTLRGIAAPMLAAWATSVIGFLAVGASSVPAMRDFAIVGSLGLGGAILAALVILPALLHLMDRDSSRGGAMGRCGDGANASHSSSPHLPISPSAASVSPPPRPSRLRFTLEPMVRWTDRHARLCIGIFVGLLLGAGILAAIAGPALFHFESDLTVMHPQPNAPLEAQAEIARYFNNPEPLVVLLKADSPDALTRLGYDVQQRLSSEPAHQAGVARTVGLPTFLPDPRLIEQRSRQIEAINADRVIADFRSALANSAFDVEAYVPSTVPSTSGSSTQPRAAYATLLRRLLTPQNPPAIRSFQGYPRLAELFLPKSAIGAGTDTATGSVPTEALTLVFLDHPLVTRQQRDQVVITLRGALADLPGATLTGIGIISYDTEHAVRRDLPRFLIVAAGMVMLYLLVHFRSFRDAGLAMLPTLLSLLCLVGAMHLLGHRLNMVNLIGMPLLIGIDVDYGIFLVSVARTSRACVGDSRAAFLQRLAASSHAILICAASTLLGFGSLVWTSVPAIRSLGWVVAVGISTCTVATFFLLAPLLLRRRGA